MRIAEWQECQNPLAMKRLTRNRTVSFLRTDSRHQRMMTVVPEGERNVRFIAQPGISAIGTDDQTRADIARAFEDAVVDTLMIKCKRALDQTGFKRLVMAGGVSANRTLRAKLAEMMKKRRGEVFYARPEFCTDNGAMIAYAGMVRFKAGATADLGVSVRPRWPLAELPAA